MAAAAGDEEVPQDMQRQLQEPGGMAVGFHPPLPHRLCAHRLRGCPVSPSREPGVTAGKGLLKVVVI